MKERPQGGVAEAIVVAIVVFTGEIDRGVGHPIGLGNLWPYRLLSGCLAAPTEPYPSDLAQGVENSGDQPAAGLLAFLRQSDAVGDDHQTAQARSSKASLSHL